METQRSRQHNKCVVSDFITTITNSLRILRRTHVACERLVRKASHCAQPHAELTRERHPTQSETTSQACVHYQHLINQLIGWEWTMILLMVHAHHWRLQMCVCLPRAFLSVIFNSSVIPSSLVPPRPDPECHLPPQSHARQSPYLYTQYIFGMRTCVCMCSMHVRSCSSVTAGACTLCAASVRVRRHT